MSETDTELILKEQILSPYVEIVLMLIVFCLRLSKKCRGLIIDNTDGIQTFPGLVTIVLMEDTLLALQQLANYWRHACDLEKLVILVPMKDNKPRSLVATILSKHFKVGFNKGSLNNHWGVPMSLLSVSKSCDVAIVEMGMNHLGRANLTESDCRT